MNRQRTVRIAKRAAAHLSVCLHGLLGNRRRGCFGILMYHRVAPRPAHLPPPTWNVTPDSFRSQLQGLLHKGYRFWPLRAAIEHSRRGLFIPARMAVITFDDGYENVYRHAWPILRELRLPATLLTVTAYLDTAEPLPFDDWGRLHFRQAPSEIWRLLTWAQCRRMEGSGLVEIGSHTHTHTDFRSRPRELEQDLRTSLQLLNKNLSQRPRAFSFPYGSRSLGFVEDSLMEAARKAGVMCALTTEPELVDPRSCPFGWGRLEVTETDTACTLLAKLEGWYSWMGAVKRLFLALSPPPYLPAGRSSSPHQRLEHVITPRAGD